MKKGLFLALLIASGAAIADGQQVLEGECMGCHVIDGVGGEKKSAPPMYAVWHHYRQAHPDKASFVAAVSAWLQQPQSDKAMMSGAIKKFGLMDKLEIDESHSRSVAEYLYDRSFAVPEWYLVHFDKLHGEKSRNNDSTQQHVRQQDNQHERQN
jgi:hypothetical protein